MNEFDAYKTGPGQDTLQALLKAQGDLIYNLCFQVLREGAQAEDASQQVLLGLVKQLPRISDASHLKAWVSRAAFHAALDLKKQARRRADHERRTAEMRQTPALTSDQVDAVHSEIARLDDDLQRVVVEHYFEKRPLRALAAEQAISEVALWKRLQKAKQRLRESLASTGFAAALLGLDSLLEALEPVRAPEGLVGPGLMTQAAAGASTPLLLAGGIAVKTKVIAGAGLIALMLVTGLAVGVARRKERTADDAARRAAREVNYPYPAGGVKPVAPPAAAAPAAADVGEEVQVFTSLMAYYEAMMKASYLADLGQRTRAFRRLGVPITEAEMDALSKECPFRPGTEEFSRHILNGADRFAKRLDPRRTLAMVRGFTDADDKTRRKMIWRLFEEWGKQDPQAARTAAAALTEAEGRAEVAALLSGPAASPESLVRLLAMAEGPGGAAAMQAAVSELVRVDPAAALRRIDELEPGPARTEAYGILAREWAARDFAGALAWVEKTTDPRRRETLLMHAVSGGAERNPQAAAEAILRLQDRRLGLGMTTVHTLVGIWAKTDPAASAKFLDRMPDLQGRRIVAVQELAPRWGAADPVEALVWAQQQPEADRAEIINAVLTGWVKSPKGSLAEARDMTRHLPEPMRPKALEAVVLAWGEIEPPAAAAFALAETPGVLGEVVSRWIKRDDAAALAWARGLPDSQVRDQALLGISGVYQETNPARAAQIIEEMRGAAARDKALSRLAGSASERTGVDSGVEIARKIQDPVVRDGALGMMVHRMSREKPRGAAGLVELISDPARRTQAIDTILTWGSEADPQACRELLSKLPRVESIHYQKLAGGFAKKDPVAAATWGLSLPEKQTDPLMGDPSKEYEAHPRDAVLSTVVNTWAAKDPDAATRWIQQAVLSESTRSGLLSVVKFQRERRRR